MTLSAAFAAPLSVRPAHLAYSACLAPRHRNAPAPCKAGRRAATRRRLPPITLGGDDKPNPSARTPPSEDPQQQPPAQSPTPQDASAGDSSAGANDEPAEVPAPHDIPQSAIDWNKSWTDFQASGAKSSAPPGREPVTKAQVAQSKLNANVRSFSNALPSRQQLFADWRFWAAIIFALSVFSAFVQSSSTVSPSPTI